MLDTEPEEVVIRKVGDDGFDGTGLHELLRSLSVTALSVCGLLSEMCVAATARTAMRLGYRVVLAHDSHATYPVPAYGPTDRLCLLRWQHAQRNGHSATPSSYRHVAQTFSSLPLSRRTREPPDHAAIPSVVPACVTSAQIDAPFAGYRAKEHQCL